MSKLYDTGKSKWHHGQKMPGKDEWHSYLGPCPFCGGVTFDYGGGWRCFGDYCTGSVNNMAPSVGPRPKWWNTDINVYMDGNSWCATRDGFKNPMESPIGFGDSPRQAVQDLEENERLASQGKGA